LDGAKHTKHVTVAEVFEKTLPNNCTLIRDEACNGKQHIPLFSSIEKSRKTQYCNVDLLVLQNDKIKIIAEIEESNVKPTQVCGKFLTSALSNYYMHESLPTRSAEMADNVTFIQILNTSKLKKNTMKIKQWKMLENSINKILPLKGSNITSYRLFSTDELDALKDAIQDVLTKST
jgi:hypothetical protein